MIYKHQYTTKEERQKIIADNSQLHLIEEQNIVEGNFLIFSNEPMSEKIIYIQVPKEDFEQSKARISDLELTIAEMMTL